MMWRNGGRESLQKKVAGNYQDNSGSGVLLKVLMMLLDMFALLLESTDS